MNSVWIAGMLSLLLAPAPQQAESSKPADTVPAPSNIRARSIPGSMPICA